MSDTPKGATLPLQTRSALVFLLTGLLLAASVAALFVQEKQKMDAEVVAVVSGSLDIHTRGSGAKLDRAIADAQCAVQAGASMLRLSGGGDDIRERLEQHNQSAPDYPVRYLSAEELAAGTLDGVGEDARAGLARGQTVVCLSRDPAGAEARLLVIGPLADGGQGTLYIQLPLEELFHQVPSNVIYQNVQSVLVTGDGTIVYGTCRPEPLGSMVDCLESYGFTQAESDRAAAAIGSADEGGAASHLGGDPCFMSAVPLACNGWRLVSVVRGSDVLLRSSSIFANVVRTSVMAILLTAMAAGAVLLLFLLGRRRLEEEQQRRSRRLSNRLYAMFEQHSALKVVLDPQTRTVVDVNPAACGYFGFARQELLGRNMREFNLLPQADLDQQFQSVASGKALFFAAPHRIKSGDIKFLDVYASMIDDDGRPLVYAILFDSTDRERYRNELFGERELLATTLRSIGDGVVTTDTDGHITSMNTVAQAITGWDEGSALGRPFAEVFTLQNEATGRTVENPIQKVLQTGRVVGLANHTELKNLRGELVPIADSAAPIKTEDGHAFGVVMVFRDVSDEKEHSRQIEYLSYHDSLTGLFNRRYIEKAMARLDKENRLPVSVMMADVNGLKITNDVFGHKAGDLLLQGVADLLRDCCGDESLIARLGGDEFLVLMPETTLEEAEAVVHSIKDTHVEIAGSSLRLSLSLGCACKDSPEADLPEVVKSAEENMYQQKLLDGKSYRSAIIGTLLATLYEKSNETEEHSKRIETYCHAIGWVLQLSSREMDELSLLALLHDIGKVGIHPNILQKPGPLTPEEWVEIKRHPEIGYRIAQATPELAIVADLILSHHERWDGEGYPRRLRGEEIPLACRILSVVDAYDAMTNDRVYRPAMSTREAAQEIRRNMGAQFDPRIAQLLLDILAHEKEPAQRAPTR